MTRRHSRGPYQMRGTICPACGQGRLRKRPNMSQTAPDGSVLALMRCTHCKHQVYRVRSERFDAATEDLVLTSPSGKEQS